MSAPPGRRPSGSRGLTRRALLGLPARREAVQPNELSRSEYAGWLARYRRGRFAEVAPLVQQWNAGSLLNAQRAYLNALMEPRTLRGLQARLIPALFHAEVVATFGETEEQRLVLIDEPLRTIGTQWPPETPGVLEQAARTAWSGYRSGDIRVLFRRELFLMAARSRLALLDNGAARRILGHAQHYEDPVIAWQLVILDLIEARYFADEELWLDAQYRLRRALGRWIRSRRAGIASPRAVVQAMEDPDDRNLRLAMIALGRKRNRVAAAHLEDVRTEVAPRLRIPRLLLKAELDLRERRFGAAIDGLRPAVTSGPTSPAAVAALVAAKQAAGRWDEAAALASDFLSVRVEERPWLDFITTWAEFGEGLPWLHEVAGIG